jgi:hypothetical protein
MTDTAPPTTAEYRDDDFVYVDPESRLVVGRVEWTSAGTPKSKKYVPVASAEKNTPKGDRPRFMRKNFPWGTYRSMCRVYRLKGKVIDKNETNLTLDDILPKALTQAFWDNKL